MSGTVDQLRSVIPGLPDWIDGDRNVGVMTVGMHADGRFQPKIYLGGSTALEAAAGSPAMDLAETMHRRCPQPGYYYLTVRPDPNGAQYAINKIYNTIQLGFINEGSELAAAWDDVTQLFVAADQLHNCIACSNVGRARKPSRRVPTATALEDGQERGHLLLRLGHKRPFLSEHHVGIRHGWAGC